MSDMAIDDVDIMERYEHGRRLHFGRPLRRPHGPNINEPDIIGASAQP